MNIPDELLKLQELHRTGGLTDDEFAKAKAAVLSQASPAQAPASPVAKDLLLQPQDDLTPQRLRTQQITAGTLLLGIIAFLAVAIYQVWVEKNGQGLGAPRDLPIITLVAILVLSVCAPLSFIARRWRTRQMLAAGHRGLMALHGDSMVVGWTLLASAAFTGCTAYLLEARTLALGVVGLVLLVMLCTFPTEARVRNWLQRQTALRSSMSREEAGTF